MWAGCGGDRDAAHEHPAASAEASSEARARCAQCGMFTDTAPQWRATAATSAGAELAFDSPKCLFRYRSAHAEVDVASLRVREYYSQTEAPATGLVYVHGSDLRSPMGRDLVPLSDEEAAAAFRADHGGESVTFEGITEALLAGLDP